jgi:hypothetical protein
MKNTRTWVVIALLLGGCTSSAADTAESTSPTPPRGEAETAITAEPLHSGDTTAAAEPEPLESVGADDREDDGFLTQPTTLPAGTYRSSTYHVPVTFTTTDELMLIGSGVVLTSDDNFDTTLVIGQPDQVVDLSPAVTLQEFEDAGGRAIPVDRLIDLPEDVGAWLDDAEAVDIVGEGSTTVNGQEAPWWDVELQDRDDGDLVCSPQPNVPPCQPLWVGGPQVGDPGGIGDGFAWSRAHRIWAVKLADRTVLAVAEAPPDDSASWLDTSEDIVASLTFD